MDSTRSSLSEESAPLTGQSGRAAEFGQTVLNLINCFVGAGILTVPFAFRLLGARAVVGLGLVTGVNWYAALLLGRSFERAAELRPEVPRAQWDLAELSKTAFGPLGQSINGIMALEMWLALETFLVLIGINASLITGASRTMCISIAGILGFLSLGLPMRAIAGCSFLSLVCMVGGLGSLVVFDWHDKVAPLTPVSAQAPLLSQTERELTAINAIGIFMYCFSGLPCVPNIRAEMRWRSEYSTAIHFTFGFAFVYYAAVGLLGYHCFADATGESFTSNLAGGGGHHKHQSFALVAAGLFAAKLQAGFPLYAAPVLTALAGPATRYSSTNVWLLRAAFTAFSVTCAIGAQYALAALAGLMGAMLTSITSVVFPCAVYTALGERTVTTVAGGRRKRTASVDTGLTLVIMLLGGMFGIVGTVAAVHRLFWPGAVLGPQVATLLAEVE